MENKKVIIFGLITLLMLSCFASAASNGNTAALSSTAASATTPTNIVVDFDATSVDSNLKKGDQGVLNLVIRNTGGQRAENVEVSVEDNEQIHTGKRLYVGRLEAAQSKTIPTVIKVDDNARPGLSSVTVNIYYDGFDAEGRRQTQLQTTWDVSIRINVDPLFQVSVSKTTYFRDTVDELVFVGTSKDSVNDLITVLSSTCAKVIGSSRTYVGDVTASKDFNIVYSIKPSSSGVCPVVLTFSYKDASGAGISDNISVGLNVEDSGVDLKIVSVSYTPTGPGEETYLRVVIKNVGSTDATDVTLYLNMSSPFAPVDTAEEYLPEVKAGEEAEVYFHVAVGWDASTQVYSLPLDIDYKVGGTSYSISKNIGLDVRGKVILEVIRVSASGGNVRIDVANIGTRAADGVKATLLVQDTGNYSPSSFQRNAQRNASFMRRPDNETGNQTGRMQPLISYKSDIKASKQTTFTFTTSATGPATLELEYTGPGNERVTQTERITLSNGGGTSGFRTSTSSTRTSNTNYYILAAAVIVVGYVLYKRRKHKKKGE